MNDPIAEYARYLRAYNDRMRAALASDDPRAVADAVLDPVQVPR